MANSLFLVERADDDLDYDEYDALVICAETAEEAALCATQWNHYDSCEDGCSRSYHAMYPGFGDAKVKIMCLGTAADEVEPGLVLGSFNAG